MRAILLCATFDSPAKCLFMEMKQFNGYQGCPCCLSPGESVQTSERGRTHAYPFDKESPTGHGELRSHYQTVADARAADHSGAPVNGMKGTTWFMFMPKFDFIRCISIDYMHQMLLGVTKQLFGLWFGKDTSKAFNISHEAATMNKRVNNIKPPNKITRVTRNIVDNSGKLKASEWRSFLLFYSAPCLFGLLPTAYFEHLLLLIQAAHILLGTSIMFADIEKSKLLLRKFCAEMDLLYGKRHESFNIHLLLHLPQKVYDLGPLWATSLFYFEDLNGGLKHFFKGTQKVEMQIMHSVCVLQKIPDLIRGVPSHVMDIIKKIERGEERYDIREDITQGIKVVGASIANRLNRTERELLHFITGWTDLQIMKFKRLYHFGSIIHSSAYLSAKRRNSQTVCYGDGAEFGQVESYIKVRRGCPNKSVCNEKCICKYSQYVAMIRVLESIEGGFLGGSNIVQVKQTQELKCIFVTEIIELCVFIENGGDSFVCKFPNNVEKD